MLSFRAMIAAVVLMLAANAAWGQWDVQGTCSSSRPTIQSGSVRVSGISSYAKYRMVCQVIVPDAGNSMYRASGVLAASYLSDRPVVLTAWHVVRSNPTVRITVVFPATGEQCHGKVYQKNEAEDVASIVLEKQPTGIGAVRVSVEDVAPGERVNLAGFGGTPRRGFLAWVGNCKQRMSYRRSKKATAMEISRPCSQGDSGGPCWNSKGQLIGIITSRSANTTIITTGERGTRCGLLHRLFPRKRSTPTTQINVNQQYVAPTVDAESTEDPSAPVIPTPPEPEEVSYDKIIDGVYAKIQANADKFRGPAGKDAEVTPDHLAAMTIALTKQLKSDPGFVAAVKGDKGDQGDPATINPADLAAAIQKTLPPLTVQTINGEGLVMDRETVPLGGTLNIHHKPLAK